MNTWILSTRDELREHLTEVQNCSNRLVDWVDVLDKVINERDALAAKLRDTMKALAQSEKLRKQFAGERSEMRKQRNALAARLQDSEDYIHDLRKQLADALERAKGWGEECEGSRLHCTLDTTDAPNATDAPDVGPADVTLYDHVVARLDRLEEFVGLDRNETGDAGEEER